jgi:hypothetical protein
MCKIMIGPLNQRCDETRHELTPEARRHLDEMLNGPSRPVDAAILYALLSETLRGPILFCLRRWNAPPNVLRECIRHFWKVDNKVILNTPGFSLERAREMFRQAGCSLPPDIPQIVRVWRGTAGRTLEQACEGLCWTLSREVACWFATLHEHRPPVNPIVVTASIRSDQILFFDHDDGLHEEEVVLDRISCGEIDPGGETEWHESACRYREIRRQAGS